MRFWEVIYDDKLNKMEVIGSSSDDTLLTKNVCDMQDAGMKVRCQTADIDTPKEKMTLSGYQIENNLYGRLITEYERLTGKLMKRW